MYWHTTGTTASIDEINFFDTLTTSAVGIDSRYFGGTSTGYNQIILKIPKIIPQEIQNSQQSKIDLENIKAKKLAQELLLDHIDEDNKLRYWNDKPIEINSKLFNDIKYEIPISKFARILAVKDKKVISELCLTVREHNLPLEDVVLAKFLHTKYNEEEMLRTANHSSIVENLLNF